MLRDMDSTSYITLDSPDKYQLSLAIINEMRLKKERGSVTVHMDGSGRIAKIQKTIVF